MDLDGRSNTSLFLDDKFDLGEDERNGRQTEIPMVKKSKTNIPTHKHDLDAKSELRLN